MIPAIYNLVSFLIYFIFKSKEETWWKTERPVIHWKTYSPHCCFYGMGSNCLRWQITFNIHGDNTIAQRDLHDVTTTSLVVNTDNSIFSTGLVHHFMWFFIASASNIEGSTNWSAGSLRYTSQEDICNQLIQWIPPRLNECMAYRGAMISK